MDHSVRVTYRTDHNKNKDMSDFDLINLDSLEFSDEQTWLCKVPGDSGQKLDITEWCLSLDWPVYNDDDYEETQKKITSILDEIDRRRIIAMPEKHKFDSRTFVRPKKPFHRPTIQSLVEAASNPPSLANALNTNRYMTYNKYNSPSAFNQPQDENDSLLDDVNLTLVSDTSCRLSSASEYAPNTPIKIDLSQPVHNMPNTFNKGMMKDRVSHIMEQSAESLLRVSPPSLVWSSHLETSGNFFGEAFDARKSINHKDSAMPQSGRESRDPMGTSMSLSILDEKDMNTSFLSQTTHADDEGLMDSLPPSLVSSIASSHDPTNNISRGRTDSLESHNVFNSSTYTRLEQNEKLLPGRPRHQMYNSFKRDNPMRNSGSYVKSKEEASQNDNGKVLNENIDKTITDKSGNEMSETVTLHFANNKFRKNINSAGKENMDASFEHDDSFYKDMGIHRPLDGRISNVTLDKQELNEIIQARQKLSLARKALPTEPERPLPNQIESSNSYVMPKKTTENSSELLTRKRIGGNYENSEEQNREPPRRNATFKKPSPQRVDADNTVVNERNIDVNSATIGLMDSPQKMDATFNLIELSSPHPVPPKRNPRLKKPSPSRILTDTIVHVKDDKNIIDINSATINLTDSNGKHEEWGSEERAMVGSSESTDTGTFSSSSPPDTGPDTRLADPNAQVASTPLKKFVHRDLLDFHHNISPIYGSGVDDQYADSRTPSNPSEATNVKINTATIVKKSPNKTARNVSPEKRVSAPVVREPDRDRAQTVSYGLMPPPKVPVPKLPVMKSGLPASKLRQYSSHRELRLPSSNSGLGPVAVSRGASRTMMRRSVYASNPALSPTQPAPLQRTDSYTIAINAQSEKELSRPVLKNPPALIRQGTETLRRDRPVSQMAPPKDVTMVRPSSVAGASQLKVTRPSVGPKPSTAPPLQEPRAAPTASALPRPSRLPGPRRTLRPPSVYSVAPADPGQY